jgi:hypothetical protein
MFFVVVVVLVLPDDSEPERQGYQQQDRCEQTQGTAGRETARGFRRAISASMSGSALAAAPLRTLQVSATA